MFKWIRIRPVEVVSRGLYNNNGEEIAVGSFGHDGGQGIPENLRGTSYIGVGSDF